MVKVKNQNKNPPEYVLDLKLGGDRAGLVRMVQQVGLYGVTREKTVLYHIVTPWYEDNRELLVDIGISLEGARREGYIPTRSFSDEEVERETEKQLASMREDEAEYVLSISVAGMHAYLFDKLVDTKKAKSREDLLLRIIDEWAKTNAWKVKIVAHRVCEDVAPELEPMLPKLDSLLERMVKKKIDRIL